jgi:hypothetical protein
LGIVAAFLMVFFPCEVFSQTASGSLTGNIYFENIKNPFENAVVKVRNVVTGKEYQSGPTDKNGLYSILKLEPGSYMIGVSTPKGDFNFEQESVIKPNEIAKLSLILKTGNKLIAILAGAKPFFATPIGIAIGVAAGAAVIYGVVSLFAPAGAKSPSMR